MSSWIKDLFDYELVKKCSNCGTFLLKFNFYIDGTKINGYRPECKFRCKKKFYHNQNRILNNHKVYI